MGGSESSGNFHESSDDSSDGVAEIICDDDVDIHMEAPRRRSTDSKELCRDVVQKMEMVTLH